MSACGGTPREVSQPAVAPAPAPDAEVHHLAELEKPHAQLLAIDWAAVHLESDADALALWQQIAPTGDDWQLRLDEIPGDLPIARQLAVALLHEGNFRCPAPVPHSCIRAPVELEPLAPAATLSDPCLRRMLAMWSIEQLEPEDLPQVRDALRSIAAIPPPESQLVASALHAIPDDDQDGRIELLVIAWQAGQHELVDVTLANLDEAHLITAARDHHFAGALEVLSAEAHRAVYLHAVTDDKLPARARETAIVDLGATAADTPKLPTDLRTALFAAARGADCQVAAAAARVLDQHGEHGFVPTRPHAHTAAPIVRALCVLASYQQLQRADEASPLATFVPARGLELVRVVYDPYNEIDADGDGDPHTERTIDVVARDGIVLPEVEEMTRAMRNCAGTVCRSEDHEIKFDLKPGPGGELVLGRLEIIDRPPCS